MILHAKDVHESKLSEKIKNAMNIYTQAKV
jgi:hypothetical protein